MEDNETNVQVEESTTNYTEYLEAINKLKSSTVSKDEYEALKQERNTLLDNLVNGQYISTENTEPEDKPDLKELRKELFKPDHELTDIEYVERALALRQAVLEQTGEDCFVGKSHHASPTNEDYEKAEKVAGIFQECLNGCNGDNGQFIAMLQSRMTDTFIPHRR